MPDSRPLQPHSTAHAYCTAVASSHGEAEAEDAGWPVGPGPGAEAGPPWLWRGPPTPPAAAAAGKCSSGCSSRASGEAVSSSSSSETSSCRLGKPHPEHSTRACRSASRSWPGPHTGDSTPLAWALDTGAAAAAAPACRPPWWWGAVAKPAAPAPVAVSSVRTLGPAATTAAAALPNTLAGASGWTWTPSWCAPPSAPLGGSAPPGGGGAASPPLAAVGKKVRALRFGYELTEGGLGPAPAPAGSHANAAAAAAAAAVRPPAPALGVTELSWAPPGAAPDADAAAGGVTGSADAAPPPSPPPVVADGAAGDGPPAAGWPEGDAPRCRGWVCTGGTPQGLAGPAGSAGAAAAGTVLPASLCPVLLAK